MEPPPPADPGATRVFWRRLGLALACAGALLALDVMTKGWAERDLRRHGARDYLGGHVTLRFSTNTGMAFGIGHAPLYPWKRTALVTYSSLVAVGLLVTLVLALRRRMRAPHLSSLAPAGLVALLAGATGNLRDRIDRGAVIDFIDVHLPGRVPWPAFNLADAYLALGLVACTVSLFRRVD